MVNKELIIDVGASEVSLALLEDKQLTELNREKRNIKFSVGDIYLGKVKKIMPGLNAAFVNVGYELSLIHISEPTRLLSISYAVFCLKKKKINKQKNK